MNSRRQSQRTTEQQNNFPAPDPVKELGNYRSFLRREALGVFARYQGKLDPSDIVQQTLMEAHTKMGQFRGQTEREMAKWLSQILAHNIADAARALRRKKRDVARERPLDSDSASSGRAPSDWIPSDQSTPSICASNAEQRLRLSAAIDKLPATQREVVVLHHLQGRSLAEVATTVERSQSSVAGLLYRALKSLRNSLA